MVPLVGSRIVYLVSREASKIAKECDVNKKDCRGEKYSGDKMGIMKSVHFRVENRNAKIF